MWLAVRTGAARGARLRLDGTRLVIGRDEQCDLVLPADAKVSRQHAALERRAEGEVVLRDLGSRNGTFVNGERVESAVLHGHEQIQLGDTVLAAFPEEPAGRGNSTVIGSRVFGAAQSALHRLRLQRSVRRATALGAVALVAVSTLGVLFAANVLPPGPAGDSEVVQAVVRTAARSVMLVEAQHQGRRVGTGTGWVLDGEKRLVATNAHVVNGGSTFWIGVEDDVYQGTIVGVAPCEDLAVLKLRGAPRLRSLPLGDQASVRQGEAVVAIGYPANASQEATKTSTTGVVSIVRTAYREPALDVPPYPNVIQTDAAINPGNSGGPLLDLEGRVIGVNSAGRTIGRDGRIIQGQSYAVGIDRVKSVLRVLRTGRSIGWSGLSFEYPSAEELEAKGLPPGLLVARAERGAARKAGLKSDGAVVLAVNGTRVTNSLTSYCDAVAGLRSGERATLAVLERGARKPRKITITMA